MKKTAMFLALLMVIGSAGLLAYPTAVDNVIENKSKSDIGPVADTAKLVGVVNTGVNKVMASEPTTTVLKPVRIVRDETLKGSKKVINTLWDVLTLKMLRDKPAEKK